MNTIEQFIVYVHWNEAHFTYIYEYHTNVFEPDNVYKNPPLNPISPIFLFHYGAPPMTAGAHSCSRKLPTCARLMPGRVIFFYACSGQRQFSTVSFSGFGLLVRVKVLGSVYHNCFPDSNPNLIHHSNRNLTLTQILTPNSS